MWKFEKKSAAIVWTGEEGLLEVHVFKNAQAAMDWVSEFMTQREKEYRGHVEESPYLNKDGDYVPVKNDCMDALATGGDYEWNYGSEGLSLAFVGGHSQHNLRLLVEGYEVIAVHYTSDPESNHSLIYGDDGEIDAVLGPKDYTEHLE